MARAKRNSKKRVAPSRVDDSSEGSENEQLDLEFLTTDPESPFADMDLIAEYSSPDFQALLTDQDKIEIAELLPDHISLTSEGYFSDEFVRYDMDFRHGIRMYQQDLAAGRYDPEWLRQAAEAMESRARGDFDKWKEEQYETFWGQKQKLDAKAKAGQSGTIKLNRLVEAGLFREGDIFSYSRTFGRGKAKLTVEKDVKIIEIDGTTVTFALPPGQLKFARRLALRENDDEKPGKGNDEATPAVGNDVKVGKAVDNGSGDNPAKMKNNARNDVSQENIPGITALRAGTIDDDNNTGKACNAEISPHQSPSPAPSSQLSAIPSDLDDVLLVSVTTLQALEDKIVTVDGRLGKRVEGNAFKNIRVKRDNQDIGSLFEIREDWYVYKR